MAAGWDCNRLQEWFGAHGDCRNEPGAARRTGPGQGGARECGGVEGGQAGDGTDYAARDQLDDWGGGDAGVGEAGVSGRAGGRCDGEAVGGNLPRIADYGRRSGGGLAGARRAAEAARGYAESEALRGI